MQNYCNSEYPVSKQDFQKWEKYIRGILEFA